MRALSPEQAVKLCVLARQAIAANLAGTPLPTAPQYASPHAVFVTLKNHGMLRGCIGAFTPQPLGQAVVENAVAAAQDPRFPPVERGELNDLDIEISILSDPVPLPYAGPDDLVKKISAAKPGLILRWGKRSATFLPQVWDDLPEPRDFLAHLCQKAGLPDDAWKQWPLEVLTYAAEVLHAPAKP